MSEVKRKLRNSKQADLTDLSEGTTAVMQKGHTPKHCQRRQMLFSAIWSCYCCVRLRKQEEEVSSCKQGSQQEEETSR